MVNLETSANVNKNLVNCFFLFKSNYVTPVRAHLQLSQIASFQFSKSQLPLYVKTRFNSYVSFCFESHNSPTYPPPDILSFRIVFLSALQEEKKIKSNSRLWCINASCPMAVAASCWQDENRTGKSSFQMLHMIK